MAPSNEQAQPAEETEKQRLKCASCQEEFEPQHSIDGLHCFTCSVHTQCACSDPSEENI